MEKSLECNFRMRNVNYVFVRTEEKLINTFVKQCINILSIIPGMELAQNEWKIGSIFTSG